GSIDQCLVSMLAPLLIRGKLLFEDRGRDVFRDQFFAAKPEPRLDAQLETARVPPGHVVGLLVGSEAMPSRAYRVRASWIADVAFDHRVLAEHERTSAAWRLCMP